MTVIIKIVAISTLSINVSFSAAMFSTSFQKFVALHTGSCVCSKSLCGHIRSSELQRVTLVRIIYCACGILMRMHKVKGFLAVNFGLHHI
jgi:hypothetical protein